jgi:hypothetical protein
MRTIFGLILSVCFFFVATHISRYEFEGVVENKTIKYTSDKGDVYLISVKNNGGNMIVLGNEDSVVELKFNSSAIFKRLKMGKKYRFKIYGLRIPYVPMYQNIISADEV